MEGTITYLPRENFRYTGMEEKSSLHASSIEYEEGGGSMEGFKLLNANYSAWSF